MRAEFDDQGQPVLVFDHEQEEDQILVEQGVWGVHWDSQEMQTVMDLLPESTELSRLHYPMFYGQARVKHINETVRVVGEGAIRLFTEGWSRLAWHYLHEVCHDVSKSRGALSEQKEDARYAHILTGAVRQALDLFSETPIDN